PWFATDPFQTYDIRIITAYGETRINNLSSGIHIGALGHSLMSGLGNDTTLFQDKVWVSHFNDVGNWEYLPAQASNSNAPAYIGGTALLMALELADSLERRIMFNSAAVPGSLVQDCMSQLNDLQAIPNFYPSWMLVWTGGNDIMAALSNKSKAQFANDLQNDLQALHNDIRSTYPNASQLYMADYFPAAEQEVGLQEVDRASMISEKVYQLQANNVSKVKVQNASLLNKLQDDLIHWELEAVERFVKGLASQIKSNEANTPFSTDQIEIQALGWDAAQNKAIISLSEEVEFRGGQPDRAFYGRLSNGNIIPSTSVQLIQTNGNMGDEIALGFSVQPEDIIYLGQNLFNTGASSYVVPSIVSGNRSLSLQGWQNLDLIFPINILSFEQIANKIHWTLLAEHQEERAVLERAINTQDFEEVLSINFEDKKAQGVYEESVWPADRLYYRLKLTDLNGINTYSQTLSLSKQDASQISWGPNPLQSSDYLYISEPQHVIIYDLQGRELFRTEVPSQQIKLPGLAGMYLMKMGNGYNSLLKVYE
ncbi:MAG: SGNH/GDSL hydrolase family protein, partial [Bacteroidota bacterium]